MSGDSWNRAQLFSATGVEGSAEWGTPWALFDHVDSEFGFDLDAAASRENAKVDSYLTKADDALTVDWSSRGTTVWLNPPYGRGMGGWLRKAYEESLKGCTVVVLTFVRADTAWWQDWAMKAAEVRLIRGRVHFSRGSRFSREIRTGPAPAPSCLLIYSEQRRVPAFSRVEVPRRERDAP